MPEKDLDGRDILPFEMGYLPEKFQEIARRELGETEEKRVRGIKQLKEVLRGDRRTRDIDFDESYLLQNLRARKFDVDRAFKNVKDLVVYSRKNTYMFTDFRFDMAVKCIRDKIVTLLPYRCHEGCAVFTVEIDKWKPSEYPMEEIQRVLVILLLQSLEDPMTQVNGFKVIANAKVTSTLRYLKYITPHRVWLLYQGFHECAPARYKGFHVVNESLPFKTAWVIFRTFLSEKIRKRCVFHSTMDTLTDYFPRAILPTTFGGDLKDYDQSNWLKRAMEPEKLESMGGGIMKHLDGPL